MTASLICVLQLELGTNHTHKKIMYHNQSHDAPLLVSPLPDSQWQHLPAGHTWSFLFFPLQIFPTSLLTFSLCQCNWWLLTPSPYPVLVNIFCLVSFGRVLFSQLIRRLSNNTYAKCTFTFYLNKHLFRSCYQIISLCPKTLCFLVN